jgi:hypothetical protein
MGNSTAIAMKHYFEIVDARAARASTGELNRFPGLGGRRVFDRKYVYGSVRRYAVIATRWTGRKLPRMCVSLCESGRFSRGLEIRFK